MTSVDKLIRTESRWGIFVAKFNVAASCSIAVLSTVMHSSKMATYSIKTSANPSRMVL